MSNIKKIIVGVGNGEGKQVRPYKWYPGSNTIAYYPLESNTNDYSGNSRNLTNSGITFSDGVGVFNGSAIGYYSNQSLFNNLASFTYSIWVNPSQITTGTSSGTPLTNMVISISQGTSYSSITYDKTLALCNSSQAAGYQYYNGQNYTYATGISTNAWCYLTYTWDGSNIKIYKNGALAQSVACGGSYTGYTNATLIIGNNATAGNVIKQFYGKLSKVIVENKAWTADEINLYYRATKSNYGL